MILKQVEEADECFSGLPTIEQMPCRSLADKGIRGPTAAHVIEEIHTPFNYAGVTFTTGTSAFQAPVGITWAELDTRREAGRQALLMAGVREKSRVLVTYPPLVNVFGNGCFLDMELEIVFLKRSGQEALILSLCRQRPEVIIGESRFIKSALQTIRQSGLLTCLRQDMIILAVGTPLDLELVELVQRWELGSVHDLYGCQEFGWLTLDGVALRDDLMLLENVCCRGELVPVVGGLVVGDSFRKGAHCLNPKGKLATYAKSGTEAGWITTVHRTTANDRTTVLRTAKSILRMKSRIVFAAPDLLVKQECTELKIGPPEDRQHAHVLAGPQQTWFFDRMLQAQIEYQRNNKKEPGWCKRDDRLPT